MSYTPGAMQTLQTPATYKLLIDGDWKDAASGRTFATINPADESVVAHVAEADAADVDLAVAAARRAFEEGPWSETPSNVGAFAKLALEAPR